MSNLALMPLLQATWETIYMVFLSSFFGISCGIILGVLLFSLRPSQFWHNKSLYTGLNAIVNTGRSIPFIILLVALIPLTRIIVGTTIGTNAAIVPLAIAAIPFYARVTESALLEVSPGLIEAAHAMGATPIQIIYKVLLPESLVSLINAGTLTVINLIGYSAMAGAIGGGGLGELAINYGYQRFDTIVMIETIIILVAIVQLTQYLGDLFAKKRSLKAIATLTFGFFILTFIAWGYTAFQHDTEVLKIGIMSGQQQEVTKVAQKVALKQYGLKLKFIPFDDYVQPNSALNNGDIDANIFQHIPYLNAQIKIHNYKITPIAKTFVYPMGFYSKKITSIDDLPYHALVAIPNDPSNEGRALLILQKAGLIKLNPKAGLFATVNDIVDNPKKLRFKTMQNAGLARVFKDATLVALTNDFVTPAGFTVKDALIKEGSNSPYANVIAVQTQDKNKPQFKELIKVMHSPAVIAATKKAFPNGGAIVAKSYK